MSSIRKITEKHAEGAAEWEKKEIRIRRQDKAKELIAEMDGSMIPTVEYQEDIQDKRKHKNLKWKELRLGAMQRHKEVDWLYCASFGSADELGDAMYKLSEELGLSNKTFIEGLGDGALWIKDQFDRIFGGNGKYLIDLYHLSKYLNDAAEVLGEGQRKWVTLQLKRMKSGKSHNVLKELKRLAEEHAKKEEISACIAYMENRKGQFWYEEAIQKGLPIGSGAIESGHRSIVQKRIKKAGTWWLSKNAINITKMRCVRANDGWGLYWKEFLANAA